MTRGKRIENCVPLERMHEFFICDPMAGVLRWKPREETCYRVATWNKRFAGKVAGRANGRGYTCIVVQVDGVRYHVVAHRLIWAMTFGEWVDLFFEVDHRNNIRNDNRVLNLRVCLPVENAKSRLLNANSTSGFKGVTWVDRYAKWGVQIFIDGHSRFQGYFDDPVEAAQAYDRAALVNFGEFARTNQELGALAA